MSDLAPRKQERDYTKEVDELFSELKGVSSKDGALDKLLALEKQTRNAADMSSTARILIRIVELLHDEEDWDGLYAQLTALSKKHGQLREATRRMVDRAMEWLPELQNSQKDKERLSLIETLRDVTEGKIYLEVPRARVTRILANIKESSGDVTGASDLLQELQVETFASMERREKLEFILEQMRLLRLKENWDMLSIVSKKINTKWLEERENEDLKFSFYGLMIQYALQVDKYLDVSKHYRSLYLSPSVTPAAASTSTSKVPKKEDSLAKKDEAKSKGSNGAVKTEDVAMEEDASAAAPTKSWQPLLRNIIFFTILAPHDNEQSDLLHRILADEEARLAQLPDVLNLAKCFTTPELTRWPRIESLYGPHLRETRVFGSDGMKGIEGDIEQDITNGQGNKRFKELHNRVVEHNIRTIAKYYKRIRLDRLSMLLDLENDKTEEALCKMVVAKTVKAKVDRPSGIVDFEDRNKGTYTVLNDWSRDVGKLMALVEATSHLIGKEHAIAQAAKQRAAATSKA